MKLLFKIQNENGSNKYFKIWAFCALIKIFVNKISFDNVVFNWRNKSVTAF